MYIINKVVYYKLFFYKAVQNRIIIFIKNRFPFESFLPYKHFKNTFLIQEMSFIYTYTVIKKYTALLQKIPDNFFKKVIELLRLSF